MSSTILLADDSLTIQKVVELTFADTEYEVIAVSSGDELMEALPKCQPAIVICDVIMPGRDGYEICQEIKSDPQWLHLPVILLTGTFEPFDRDRALAAGCSEIVTKPFEAKKLVDAVERLSAAAGAPPAPASTVETARPDAAAAPPAMAEADELEEFANGLEDTAVSEEWGPPAAAEPMTVDEEVEPVATGAAATEEPHETLEINSPPAGGETEPDEIVEVSDFELDLGAPDDTAQETTSAAEVQTTGDGEPFEDFTADTAQTLATAEIMELRREGGDEVFEIPPPEPGGDQSPPVAGEDPFAEPPPGVAAEDEDLEATRTTPIHVESAMAEREPSAAADMWPEDVPELAEQPRPPQETEPSETLEWDAPELEQEAPESLPDAVEDEISNAETQDFTDPPPAPVDEAGAPDEGSPALHEAGAANGGLSDADVDRIARRLLELAGDRIERIAWDVIPDMAEIVVRERVREIEASSEPETR